LRIFGSSEIYAVDFTKIFVILLNTLAWFPMGAMAAEEHSAYDLFQGK